MNKKPTLKEELKKITSADIKRMGVSGMRELLKRTAPQAKGKATILSNKLGLEKKQFKSESQLKTANQVRSELERQIKFLTSKESTVSGYKHKQEVDRLRLLQNAGLAENLSDYMREKGYSGIKGVARAEKELIKKSYEEHPEITNDRLNEVFSLYGKMKEIEPNLGDEVLDSDRAVKEITRVSASTRDYRGMSDDEFEDYIRKHYPDLPEYEINKILDNSMYNRSIMGVIYAGLTSEYRKQLDDND